MQFSLSINAVSKELRSGSLQISRNMNGRATASFAIMSADQSYRPPLNATVEIQVEGVTIFGGLITVPREKGLFGGVKPNIVTQVTAADYNVFADRRFALEELPAGTLKAALQVLLPYLTDYGVTLDAGQVDGPTLPALSWNYKRVSDCFNELMTLTAQFGAQYVWEIDTTKVLRAYQPSTVSAPFDLIADGNGAVQEVIGDVEVEQSLENFSNKIIVKVPARTETDRQESFVGDGVTTTVQLQYTVISHYGHVLVGSPPGSGGGETFQAAPAEPQVQWEFDPIANTMTRMIGPLANGETYTLQFTGTFEATGLAEDAASIASLGIFERVIQVEEVPEGSTAQSLADAYLAMYLVINTAIRYKTLQHGLAPGQTQTTTIPARNLSGTAIITALNMREFGPARVVYDVEAIVADDTNILRQFSDLYKLWRGDLTGTGGGTTITQGAGPVRSVGPAPPLRSIQYNDEGNFGGDAAWLWYEEFATATLGSAHAPGGANNLLVGQGHTVL